MMKCPIDGTDLVMTSRQGIEIDYCPKCRGVWLDRGELDKLIEREGEYIARSTAPAQTPTQAPTQTTTTAPYPAPTANPYPPRYDDDDDYDDDDRRYRGGYPPRKDDDYHRRKKKRGFLDDMFEFFD